MSMITEAASYRGVVTEHSVVASSGGCPQLALKLRALELHDFEEKMWVDYQHREDSEITAFLTLFNAKGDKIFHTDDVMRVFEWDGASLMGLNELDLEGAEVQFDVISDTYENKTRLKVAGIKAYNDTPGTGGIKKLDNDALAQMNAKFANSLKQNAGAPKAAKAPASAPATAPAAPPATTTTTATAPATPKTRKNRKKAAAPPPPPAPSEAEVVAAAAAPAPEPVSEKNDVPAPAAPPAAPPAATPPPPPPAAAADAPVPEGARSLTYETAWAECCDRRSKGVDDDTLGQAFTRAMYSLAPDKSETEISGITWGKIADTVVAETGVF